MKKYILISLLALLILPACDNKIEIVGPQKETVVVYGLINKNDSIHYIKINKGFISETEAPVQLAKDADNLFFDSLKVELINTQSGMRYLLSKEAIEKDPGNFASDVNYVYSLNQKFAENTPLQIRVENPLSGNVYTSNCQLIGDPKVSTPSQVSVDFYRFAAGYDFPILFTGNRDAERYQILIHFLYEEIDQTNQTIKKDTITWNFSQGRFSGNKNIIIRTDGQVFYDFLSSQLEQKPSNIQRRGLSITFEYWFGDKELDTYADVYGNTGIGVVQKKPEYSNIDGGYGLFASRSNFRIVGSTLSTETKQELKTNPVMTKFNFTD